VTASDGADDVTLQVRTNPGEGRGPVARIASGGERSRIHLGLAVLRQDRSGPPPLVRLYDEIDAGLGMDAAPPVARLLRRLATTGQVLCITHLATMAVAAADHLRVTKRVQGGRTSLAVEVLTGENRVAEVVRLLGGDAADREDPETRRAYARQLIGAGGAA